MSMQKQKDVKKFTVTFKMVIHFMGTLQKMMESVDDFLPSIYYKQCWYMTVIERDNRICNNRNISQLTTIQLNNDI